MLPRTPVDSGGLKDALSNTDLLASINLPPRRMGDAMGDTGPWAVHYEPHLDVTTDMNDVINLAPKRYAQELNAHMELGKLVEQGADMARMLYAWRCCSIAVPQIKSHDQPNRMEIYQKTIEVLEPEMNKIRKLLQYQQTAMDRFCEEVTRVSAEEGNKMDYVSDTFYLTMAGMLDTFAILEEVKNIKTSLRNDYSTYRRAVEIVTRPNYTTAQEAQQLSLFLGTHNVFRTFLKEKLQKIPNYEDVLADLVNACLRMIEGELFLYPEEKFALVKAIGFGLYLIDGPRVNINRMEGKRRVNLSKVDKLFKEVEVVPLYGDMAIAPFRYIETSANYEEGRWSYSTDTTKTTGQADLIGHVTTLRTTHNRLLGELALLEKDIVQYQASKKPKTVESKALGYELDRSLVSLSIRIIKLLAEMSTRIQELVSWKLLHPTDIRENQNCPEDAEEYEKATRYNYNKEEKNALVEVIALLKGAHAQVSKMAAHISAAMRRCAHVQLQELVQRHIRHALRKAVKHKRDLMKGVLVIVHLLCAELSSVDKNAAIEDILEGKKSDENANPRIPDDAAELGETRLYILRTLLESLVEKSSSKKTHRRDLESQHVTAIENFLKSSFLWPHMFYYADSLHRCCDLSQLWYREFYIEMSLGKRIQFPIQMSLPWILTDHVLELKDASMMEHLLSPMELYNDSANFALKHFKRQYLYDEIEAEINLCLDQLVFKLSERIFAHYKHLAACVFLNKRFKVLCTQYGLKVSSPTPARYAPFLRQCNMQLLGQTIDLCRLLTQRLNVALHKSADVAISRFECGDLTGVVELVGMLDVNRLTHGLLSEHVTLDPFPSILHEANHSVVTACGRVPLYIFLELNNDFLPHYCYNAATNRFVRTTFPLAEVIEREKPPSVSHVYLWGTKGLALSFGTIYAQYSNFFGPPHLEAICTLLGYQDIAIILKQLMEVTKELVQCSLEPYVKALGDVMPKKLILPRYEYGSQGVLSYYLAQLSDILLYSDLQPKVYQGLREIGNAIIFSLMLTQALSGKESRELKHSGAFQHVIPKPYLQKKEKETKEEREARLARMVRRLEEKYSNIHASQMITKFGTPDQRDIIPKSDILTKEKLCTGLSIFEYVLASLRSALDQMDWKADENAGSFLSADDNKEFHRLWSALHLVYCIPPRSPHEYTVEQLFGEGLQWAGCAIVCLLGQQRRFEALDFCYHLLKVNRMDKNTEVCKGVDMRRMIDRVRKFQILNAQIFHVINKYGKEGAVPTPTVLQVQPPSPDHRANVPVPPTGLPSGGTDMPQFESDA